MREFARIQRIIDLISQLWTYDNTLTLGELLKKWIWVGWVECDYDFFHPEDDQVEQSLKKAIEKAQLSLTSSELTELQKNIIRKMEEVWSSVPDQRFGQFLSRHAFGRFMNHQPGMLLQQKDETILKALQQ